MGVFERGCLWGCLLGYFRGCDDSGNGRFGCEGLGVSFVENFVLWRDEECMWREKVSMEYVADKKVKGKIRKRKKRSWKKKITARK